MIDYYLDYANSLRDFLLNEIESWYLYLQNFELGSQARPDYTYKAKRRARIAIYVNTLATPSTPPGPYTLAPNADLVLSAGEYLEIDGVFETEFGTQFTASIDYEQCNPNKSAPSSGDSDDFEEAAASRFLIEERKQVLEEKIDDEGFTIYPNPTNGKFKLSCTSSIKVVTCHTITGLVVYRLETDSRDWESERELPPGTYIVRCLINNRWQQQKLVVL